jgi:hypothetical protein
MAGSLKADLLRMGLRAPQALRGKVQFRLTSGATLAIGVIAFLAGCVWAALDMIGWYLGQQYFAIFDQQSLSGIVVNYYLVELLAICVTAGGAYLIYKGIVRSEASSDPDSIRDMMAEALRSRKDFWIGVVAALAYGVVYLLVSSILVYQPSIDFQTIYGVSSPTWVAAACCGSPGTVPALIVYLLPQAHLALQILPLDALFALVVPMLVGLNVTMAAHAFRNKALRSNTGWLGSIGLLAGLFTGCPTCAGLFLAGAVGGFGATSLAVALAPYQILFVLVSIPLLLASPIIMATYSKKVMRAACAVPLPKSGAARSR